MDTEATPFTLREPRRSDLPHIRLLLSQEHMPVPAAYLDGTVAVNEDDVVVGYIRILKVTADEGEGSYIAPVVVFDTWRGYGVGKALVEYELNRNKELKLVACKPSREFYRHLDFEEIGWDHIASEVENDCTVCPEKDRCGPVPFRKKTP